MVNSNSKVRGIADEAIRASRMLERNRPVQLAPTGGGKKFTLQQNPSLGTDFAVVTFVTSNSQHQFTVCRPIGVTDLAEDDWICLPSSEVQPAISRARDPNAGEVNRQLHVRRMEMAVSAKLLVRDAKGGEVSYLYPNSGRARNEQLTAAKKLQKAEIAKVKMKISTIDDRRSLEWAEAHRELQECTNVTFFMEENDGADEESLQRYFRSKVVTSGEDPRNVSDYRTRVGPFSDQPQVAVKGMNGLPLHDVISNLQRIICLGGFEAPPVVSKTDRGRDREKEVEKPPSPSRSKSAASRVSQAIVDDTGETAVEVKKSVMEQLKEIVAPASSPGKGKKKKDKSGSSEQA